MSLLCTQVGPRKGPIRVKKTDEFDTLVKATRANAHSRTAPDDIEGRKKHKQKTMNEKKTKSRTK